MDIDGNPIDSENYCGKRVASYIGLILFCGTVCQGVEWNTGGGGLLCTVNYAGENGNVHTTELINKTTLKDRLLCYKFIKEKDPAAAAVAVDDNIDNPFKGQNNNNNQENRGGNRCIPYFDEDSGRGRRRGGGRGGSAAADVSNSESTKRPKYHNKDDVTIKTFQNYNPVKPNIKIVQHTDPREEPKDDYDPIFKISYEEKFEAKFILRPINRFDPLHTWEDDSNDDDNAHIGGGT